VSSGGTAIATLVAAGSNSNFGVHVLAGGTTISSVVSGAAAA
jgi:hypothetical protein